MQKRMLGIRDQRGFTSIEIIMVIVLLAIIAAIAILTYNDMKDKAKDATANGIVGSIATSTAIGYADKAVNTSASTYPTQDEVNTTYFNKGVTNLNDGGAYWTAATVSEFFRKHAQEGEGDIIAQRIEIQLAAGSKHKTLNTKQQVLGTE